MVSVTGSCQDVPEVPEAIRRVFVVSQDITAEEHVRMQAAIQAFVDNSISQDHQLPRRPPRWRMSSRPISSPGSSAARG